MAINKQTATEQWVNIISQNELPAITSTAILLDKFSNDDKSSLPKLSQSILHDQALSSCILKVANNVQHMGHAKVSTVSRACVVLGIQSVKNICLTSKLIENVFKSKNLSNKVYNHLVLLMASSFYAGLLAKMMVPNFNEDTQEEVYLAAMLYRIGESAFWSVGEDLAEQLIEFIHLPKDEFNQKSIEIIGTTFADISMGLAQQWGLGTLLEKSLDQPECRTNEMKIIYLADKLSHYIAFPPDSISEFNQVIDAISELNGIKPKQLIERVKQTRNKAITLLSSYGAHILKGAIKPIPTIADFKNKNDKKHQAAKTPESEQLNFLMTLTELAHTNKDVNELLQLTVKRLVEIFPFQRCTFLMITSDKGHIKSRFSYDKLQGTQLLNNKFAIVTSENVFSKVINSPQSVCINNFTEPKWRNDISKSIEDYIDLGTICFAPVEVNNHVIGLITAQKFIKPCPIDEYEFQHFSFLVKQLSMCLSLISRQ